MRLVLSPGFAAFAFASVASATLLGACKGSSSSGPPAAVRFLPADPDTAFRIDVPRIRGWSIYKQLSTVALSGVEMILKSANDKCGLDVMGTATTIIGAKKDALMAGDVTLIVAGISHSKVAECLDTIATSKSMFQVTRDGDLFHAKVQDKSVASGAILPTGEVVLVARKGAGIEAGAWKAEVTQGAKAVPAWWTELEPYLVEPIAVRAADGKRTVFATATFTDALAVRAKVVTKSDAEAKGDTTRINAILSYLKNANAGDGKVETQGANVFAEITAKGPQIEALIKTGGGAVFTRNAELPTEPATASRDYECSELSQAVGDYMNAALESAGKSPQMVDMVTKVTPPLKQAYVDACTEGDWADAAIECHVINATNLPKFEKCRVGLSEAQRGPFDAKVSAVLSQIQAPATGSGSAAGSGSATPTK
ncbi:MAG: hypothetical protein ACKV2T_24135 [Kofleriaceae bacterium]